MIEHEQINIIKFCKRCSEEKDKWGRKKKTERKFISHVNDPNRFVCGSCGCFVKLTDKEIKDAQLNTMEVKENG